MKRTIKRWSRLVQLVKSIEKERELLAQRGANMLMNEYSDLVHNQSFKSFFRSKEFKVYSQNGEDGLLLYLLDQVGIANRTMIEFGIGDGRQCNSANLILNFGFNNLLIEGNRDSVNAARKYYFEEKKVPESRLKIKNAFITAENINDLFKEEGFEGEIDILSVDIDGNDYWVWDAINVVNPRIVVAEYNGSFGIDKSISVSYDPSFSRMDKHPSGWFHGASLLALEKLGKSKGYSLIGCDSHGVNVFFVRKDLMKGSLQIQEGKTAYYPVLKRTRKVSAQGQWDMLKELAWEEV